MGYVDNGLLVTPVEYKHNDPAWFYYQLENFVEMGAKCIIIDHFYEVFPLVGKTSAELNVVGRDMINKFKEYGVIALVAIHENRSEHGGHYFTDSLEQACSLSIKLKTKTDDSEDIVNTITITKNRWYGKKPEDKEINFVNGKFE